MMEEMSRKILSESIPILILATALEISGGQLLNNEESFTAIPLLLVTVPVINGLFGNLGSILGARLSTGLHLGQADLSMKNEKLKSEIIQSVVLGIFVAVFLGIFIWVISPAIGFSTGELTFTKFMIIIFGTGIIMTLIITFSSVGSAFFSFRKGIDPDNVVATVASTSGDVLGISTLILMVGLVL